MEPSEPRIFPIRSMWTCRGKVENTVLPVIGEAVQALRKVFEVGKDCHDSSGIWLEECNGGGRCPRVTCDLIWAPENFLLLWRFLCSHRHIPNTNLCAHLKLGLQHATTWPAEAKAMAGGADSIREVSRSQLAGPGRLLIPYMHMHTHQNNESWNILVAYLHLLSCFFFLFFFTVSTNLPNPLETCCSSWLEYWPRCYTLQELGHAHR